jgi:two-component system chemotaxis family response regulator WspR
MPLNQFQIEQLKSRQSHLPDARLITELAHDLEVAERRIRELSIDPTTLLPTRLQCEEHLAQAWQRALRSPTKFGVMIIDADYFKRINDTEGHPAGDDALRRIAGSIRAATRRADYVGRWGGDEFIVVVEAASDAGMRSTEGRIHDRVKNEAPTSVTVGWSVEGPFKFLRDFELQDIIAAADRDLLARKHAR